MRPRHVLTESKRSSELAYKGLNEFNVLVIFNVHTQGDHQPLLPGTPLNGPAKSGVIQPP